MHELNVMLSTLRLAYPPVSNFEAESVKEVLGVEQMLRESDFYMIGTRAEAYLESPTVSNNSTVTVTIAAEDRHGRGISDEVHLDLQQLANDTIGGLPDDITMDGGRKHIRFWPGHDLNFADGSVEPFEWFTTEKLIHDRGRGIAGISGFDTFRDFATYELLYVGIAKTADTYDRLFNGAHHARQRILSVESPRRQGSRVTDELVLFAFTVEPLVIRTWSPDHGSAGLGQDEWDVLRKKVVIDAEKAFVHLLNPQYNVTRFASYPKSADGLYGTKYRRYGFAIGENMTFTSGDLSIRGSWRPDIGGFDGTEDTIVVADGGVQVLPGQGT